MKGIKYNELTSLIKDEDIHTHTLVRDVLVDLPGRDEVRDFLALAKDGVSYRGDKVYESENKDAAVSDLSANSSLTGTGECLVIAFISKM